MVVTLPSPRYAGQAGATGVLSPPQRRSVPVRTRRAGPPRPPSGDDDSGGDGGGSGGDDGAPGADGGNEDLGRLALGLALFGITTLFLVLIAVWFFLRRPSPDWAPPGQALDALWISTALLAASSLAIEVAARRRRAGARAARRASVRWLALAFLLGVGFLLAQLGLWWTLWQGGTLPSSGGYAAVFFSLTGLHALHVLGGLGFFGVLGLQLARPAESGPRPLPGLRLGAIYWHFMGGLWLVLFTLLYFVR